MEGKDESGSEKQRVVRIRKGIVGSGQRMEKEDRKRRGKTYKGCNRAFARVDHEGGLRAEAWSLEGVVTAFDAESAALVREVELCYLQASPGAAFNIFTDSQAAMARLQDDRPGHGQHMASRGIMFAKGAYRRGASITISWVPGHAGVLGNEIADQWATEAATRELRTRGVSSVGRDTIAADTTVSRTFLKSALRRRAVSVWRDEIRKRSQGREPFRAVSKDRIPSIPRALRRTNRSLASRFFQLASGHGMIAPFLKEKYGWVESDVCWCSNGRQSREHLFKECRTWRDEIRLLWKTVGDISGEAKSGMLGSGKGKKVSC